MTYAAGTHVRPGTPVKDYVGWEPSDLEPRARVFENEKVPEEYYGWEPSDLHPHARQFQPRPAAEYAVAGLRPPPCPKTLTPTHPHGEYKRCQDNKKRLTPGPFEPFAKSTVCSLRTT